MVIKITDHLQKCLTNQDGQVLFDQIHSLLEKGEKVEVSFKGIDSMTSSFVNSAFIELLEHFSFAYIRSNLNFLNSTKQINDIIKSRFKFETEKGASDKNHLSACSA